MRKTGTTYAKASAAILLLVGTATYATSASACIGDTLSHPASAQESQSARSLFHDAEYSEHSIVGLWSFTMTPTAGPGDFGFQQWHSDGTELMNSGGRSPASENFCMGVWRSIGQNRYHLNHVALSYDPASGQLNARVNIKEDVSVDSGGNSYSGTFTLDVYDPTGAKQVAHQQGQVTAQRIRAN